MLFRRHAAVTDRLLAHDDEFLACCGMYGHGGVKIVLGCLHFHRNGEHLDQFGSTGPRDMAAYNLVARAIHHQLHKNTRVATGKRGLHWPEARLVDVDLVQPLARLRLGQSDNADLRFREHRTRHIDMIDWRRLAAVEGVSKGVTLTDRHRRQVHPVSHVTYRVDISHRRARICVDRNTAMLGKLDAEPLQCHSHHVRAPADREHDLVSRDRAVVRKPYQEFSATAFDCCDHMAADDRDAAACHLGTQVLAYVVVEAAEDVLPAIDQRHLAAEASEDIGEFDRDIAAALNHNAARQFPQMESFV